MKDRSDLNFLGFDLEVEMDNDPCSPIIGEDIFISGPYYCSNKCSCKRISPTLSNLQNNSDTSPKGTPQRSSSSMDSVWDTYVDPTFVEHDFPMVLTHSASWEDIFSNPSSPTNGSNFIKEIFINSHHLLEPDVVEAGVLKIVQPRQKFQRFREKRFICDECNRSFTMKQNVQQHFFQYHNPNGVRKTPVRVVAKRFQCTKCKKIFKTLEKAQKHEARLHGEKAIPNVFVCQHCNKIYNTHSQLKEHIDVVHQNLRPYKCEQCGTEFGRAGGLRRHDSMVHKQKKHECPYEGCKHPGYKCTKALAAHIRSVHTLDRPFSCLFCERTFVRKNDLKVHELTHSTQCDFSCRKCNSSFRRLIYLQKHEKRCSGGLKRRRLRRSLRENGNLVCATRPQSVKPCDSDDSVIVESSEFECDEHELPQDFPNVTGDELLEKPYPLTVEHVDTFAFKGRCLEICQVNETVEDRESGSTDHDFLEEGEIYESQSTFPENLPRKSVHKGTEWTVLSTTERRINHDIMSSVINKALQASSSKAVKASDSFEDGEIQEVTAVASMVNGQTFPFDNNVKKKSVILKKEQRSEWVPQRSTRFEPRDEAVALTETPRYPLVSLSTSSVKLSE